MRIYCLLPLVALGASGPSRAVAFVAPPATNHVVLLWDSLGPGTQYYVETSTNLLMWINLTNTIATNASLTFTGDTSRTFRLWASNSPPQTVTLDWDSSAPSSDVAGYLIYYGGMPNTYTNRIEAGLATRVTVSNLVAGVTYYFAATAYSSAGLESDYSNEAVWQCPFRLRTGN
jgi:hypothetical protein